MTQTPQGTQEMQAKSEGQGASCHTVYDAVQEYREAAQRQAEQWWWQRLSCWLRS